jgi:tetratricopeptide (TPR) repeat protein
VWLLASIAGEEVVRADPDEALELVSLCGNLPLAVRIAGNRLATQRHWSLTYLVGQLRDERMRLTSLSAGDWQVRPAFEVSFRRLSPPAQRVFRRLTLVPGAHFGDDLAAVATGVPAGQIGTLLGELADASLLNAAGGRLRFHDLIRLFASERLAADEPEDVRNQLRDNLYRYVLGRAVAAGRLVFPDVLEVPADGPFATVDQAQEWLRQEGVNWSCAQRAAEELGWHREALELAQAMHWYADSHEAGYRWDEVYGVALRAARALGDRVAEVDMLNQLGWALYLCRNDNELAHATNSEALRLAEEVGDHRGTVFAHGYLGVELMRLGRNDEGLAHSYRACELAAGCDFFDVQVGVRTTLGVALRTAGRFDEALAVHSAVLTELDEHRDETNPVIGQWVAMVQLENIGLCLSGLERWREAATSHRDARLVSEEYRMAYHEVEQAVHEGVAWREAGEYDLARQCLALARDLLDGPVHHVGREKVDAEFALLPEQDERQWWRQE